VFLGPVLLALGLALLKEWAAIADDAATPPPDETANRSPG